MIIITLAVNAPLSHVPGIKEQIVEDLESYGDVRVLKIEEPSENYEQLKIGGQK